MKKILLVILIFAMNINAADYLKKKQTGCENDIIKECLSLGYSYEKGVPPMGIKKDINKSMEAYKKACDLGSADGCMNVAYFYKKEARPNGEMTAKFTQKSCELGNIHQCKYLGYLYREGKYGLKKDYVKAAKFFEISCNKEKRPSGRANACYSLGMLYKDGHIENKDPAKMVALIKKGCEGKVIGACSDLEEIYADESLGLKNETKAKEAKEAEIQSEKNLEKLNKETKELEDKFRKKYGNR